MNAEFAKKYPDPIDQHKRSDEYFALLKKNFGGDDLAKRIGQLREFLSDARKHPRVVVVSHSGIIGLWVPDLVSVSQKGSYLEGDYKNGKNCSITYYSELDGRPALLIPPNTVHLGISL
jgi:broad specificity phosphatase PhoE